MKRALLLAAMISVLGANVAHALVLQVNKQGDKGDVILRLGMTTEEYQAAKGILGGGGEDQVTDSSIPGMNDINISVPLAADRYARVRTNAANDAKTAGTSWCVVCATGGTKLSIKALTSFAAAMIGTSQCEEKSKSQNLEVVGSGSCALDGN